MMSHHTIERAFFASLSIASEQRRVDIAAECSAKYFAHTILKDFAQDFVDDPAHFNITEIAIRRRQERELTAILQCSEGHPEHLLLRVKENYLARQIERIVLETKMMPNGLERFLHVRDETESILRELQVSSVDNSHERFLHSLNGTNMTKTGMITLDKWLGGFEDGDYVIIGARPSVGKTAFAASLARSAVKYERVSTVLFSYEMEDWKVRRRILANEVSVSVQDIRLNRMTDKQRHMILNASELYKGYPLQIVTSAGMPGAVLANRIKLSRAKLFIIDYIQKVPVDGDTFARVTEASRLLQEAAKSTGKIVVALAQLSRGADDDRLPRLSDLRDSGYLEQDADVVILLHQERKSALEDVVQIQLVGAKNREGSTMIHTMSFHRPFSRFFDMETHYRDQQDRQVSF